MVQLEAEDNGWPAWTDDVPVGYLYISEPLFGPTVLIQRIAAVPFGVYAIVQNFNMPIQIQPQVFCALALVSWGQVLIYNNKWTTRKASVVGTVVGVAFGGIEALLILTLRPLYDRQVAWPIMFVGIVAAILLAAGLLPPYFELWKRSGRVVGINFIFLTIDWLGAFFSLMGVVAQNTFDPLGGCLFMVCIVIEGGIFVSQGIWLFRTRKLRAAAKGAGRDLDELPQSDVYHVEVPRKGSIAASRDVERDEIARRGSLAVARDLEHGEGSMLSVLQHLEDGISKESRSKTDVEVRCEEVRAGSSEGVQEIDYGTMERSSAASRTRPVFKRQDTNTTCFKEPQW
ncbi:hypothetical protein HO173_002322 [Letharia columbiana]|uniref:PQ loop repeat protein n=1 Tax=Letharia columbiana TaxID=112416 RepID=A0A8H6G3J0_9LECA|nr:uncharacterized protein HO173_002322 [Letharia columbiana]KAF6239776.1 hypothetical protein HO173_002322 [Letharia columbiana]